MGFRGAARAGHDVCSLESGCAGLSLPRPPSECSRDHLPHPWGYSSSKCLQHWLEGLPTCQVPAYPPSSAGYSSLPTFSTPDCQDLSGSCSQGLRELVATQPRAGLLPSLTGPLGKLSSGPALLAPTPLLWLLPAVPRELLFPCLSFCSLNKRTSCVPGSVQGPGSQETCVSLF